MFKIDCWLNVLVLAVAGLFVFGLRFCFDLYGFASLRLIVVWFGLVYYVCWFWCFRLLLVVYFVVVWFVVVGCWLALFLSVLTVDFANWIRWWLFYFVGWVVVWNGYVFTITVYWISVWLLFRVFSFAYCFDCWFCCC